MSSRRINQLLVRLILFRLYIPLLVLGFLAIAGLGYYSARNQVNHQSQTTRSLAQLMEYHLDQGERILRALAIAIDASDRQHAAVFIKSTWDSYGYFETLYYLDEQNRVFILMPEDPRYTGLDLSNVPGIREMRNGQKFSISPPYLSVRTGESVVMLIQDLPHAGKIVGELKLGLFQKEISNIQKQSDTDFIFIADQNGTLLAHPDVNAVNERNNISNLALFQAKKRNAGALIYTYGGVLVLGVSTTVDKTGWVIVDQVTLARFGRTYVWTIGQIFLVSLSIWALLRWGLRKQLEQKVSRPLEELSRQTTAITDGDFQVVESHPSPEASFLELDQLAADFTVMISRLQARETALRASELRYRSLFESAREGILILDAETGIIVDANPFLIQLQGYSLEELLGKKVWELDFFRNIIANQDQFKDLKEKGYTRYEDRIMETSSGQRIEVEFVSNVLQVNEQKVVQCNIRDITERKQAEEELRESEAQNRALLSAIPDLIFTNRRDGEFLAAHASDPRQLFLPQEAFLHRRVEDVLPEPLAELFTKTFTQALDSGALQEIDYAIPIEGEEKHFEARVVPCTEDTVITIVRDITERKHAEERQRCLQAQLQQAQKMESLGSLAGGVAHDMNNVLGAILVTASANLEAQSEGSPAHRAFDTIYKAAVRGGQMVKGLLSLARKSPAEEHEVDLNLVLREEVRLLERTTLSKVRLEMDLASDLRPIRGDASALTHAIMNLCVNAVDAMPDNGTLILRTQNVDNDWIEVLVEDTGTGMPKEVLEKAMDPFFTTKEVGKGTGLGLSMVYSIVKGHHGLMEIQSKPGQGTSVRIRFPACEVVNRVPEPAVEPRSMPPPGALNVLLVDDDELFRSSMQAILEDLGHNTAAASSGEEALAQLEAGLHPDVVILDMNMPGIGGAGTLPRLRGLRPTVPILLATGRADQTALDLIETHPFVTLLSKPFSMKELQQHLEPLGRR